MSKKDRRKDIAWCWITALAIIVAIWFFSSLIEVWRNNSLYWETGVVPIYSELNLFQIIANIRR